MRFLVLGASGMAGHTICRYLLSQGHNVVGFARQDPGFIPVITGDALDRRQLLSAVESEPFDVVVNAIGVLNEQAERDKEAAVYLNSLLPHQLAAITERSATRIVHISTDCVFAGNAGPYDEASVRDGATFYDRSKALGELADDKNITLRMSIIGPDIDERGIGLLNWFMAQQGPVPGFSNVLWTGLTTLELAKAIEAVAEDGTTGLVNMVPDEPISKCELLGLFNVYLRDGSVSILPSDEPHLDKTLKRTNFDSRFRPASYEQQIADLADWVLASPTIYPHYRLD